MRLFRRDAAGYETRRVMRHRRGARPAKSASPCSRLCTTRRSTSITLRAKQDRYATWSALDAFDAGKRPLVLRLLTHAPLRFFQLYAFAAACSMAGPASSSAASPPGTRF